MASDDSKSKSRSHIQLQLRVRALHFDKAGFSLFLPSNFSLPSSSLSSLVSLLNPNYFQLHADDVYFSLEDGVPQRDSKVQPQRFRQEDFPDTWYHQCIDNYMTIFSLQSSRFWGSLCLSIGDCIQFVTFSLLNLFVISGSEVSTKSFKHLPSFKCNPDCTCDAENVLCAYERQYAEMSSSNGVLGEDIVSFGNQSELKPQRAVFGCENSETGDLH